MSSTTSSPASSPCSSPTVSCDSTPCSSVPATPTQRLPRSPALVKRPMPDYAGLGRTTNGNSAWVLYCLPTGEWAVGFVPEESRDDHLWLLPFNIALNQQGVHPWTGEDCLTWLVQDYAHGNIVESFVAVRVHRKSIADFYRLPADLAIVKSIDDLTRVKFRLPYYAPHYPAFFAAQVAQRVANDRAARGEGTPMNIAPAPLAPERKRKPSFGIPLRQPNSTPYKTPQHPKKARTELPFALPVPESPVSKSMDTTHQ